ncbi:MAG: hypothetical protein JST93_17175 [Acidobacteria bacterium]|nr:hypothetical protein [Acidobacteriota bacterium]
MYTSLVLVGILMASGLMGAQLTTPSAAPIRKEEKPAVPARIRVGCSPQSVGYNGPAALWRNAGPDSLSDEQIASLEAALVRDAEDVCARGYLIAHGQSYVPRRLQHVLWMIEHHPEWKGFLHNRAQPEGALGEIEGRDRIRAAWLKHVAADGQSGAVLHHAAVFFEWSDPLLAEELLERAIRVEPREPLHVERLGALYGRWSLGVGVVDSWFPGHARAKLLSSRETLVVVSALHVISPNPKAGRGGEWGDQLRSRLRQLAGDQVIELPSQSDRYRNPECTLLPLLRRCVDR